jgi:4a-hydroxytetrahydrobiopterin dehydratase
MRFGRRPHRDYLVDALSLLKGWTHEGPEFRRTLRLDDSQHAALAERLKVVADALHLRPEVRRQDGQTQIRLCTANDVGLSRPEVALAARIEEMYRRHTPAPWSRPCSCGP